MLGGRGGAETRPRDVAGFALAKANGQVPVVPARPPSLLPGVTAGRAAKKFALKAVCVVLVVVVGSVAVASLAEESWWWPVPVVGGSVAAYVVLVRWWAAQVGERKFRELHTGYTTFTMTSGAFTMLRRSRRRGGDGWVPWDYSGCWVLDGKGQVVSAPDGQTDPPGFYPSPTAAGKHELWTGCTWAGQFRGADGSWS